MKDDITFNCSHCQQKIQCDASMADHEVDCPVCAHRLMVPTPDPESVSSQKICGLCHKLVDESEEFCPHCWYNFLSNEEPEEHSAEKDNRPHWGVHLTIATIVVIVAFFIYCNQLPEMWKMYPKLTLFMGSLIGGILFICLRHPELHFVSANSRYHNGSGGSCGSSCGGGCGGGGGGGGCGGCGG